MPPQIFAFHIEQIAGWFPVRETTKRSVRGSRTPKCQPSAIITRPSWNKRPPMYNASTLPVPTAPTSPTTPTKHTHQQCPAPRRHSSTARHVHATPPTTAASLHPPPATPTNPTEKEPVAHGKNLSGSWMWWYFYGTVLLSLNVTRP